MAFQRIIQALKSTSTMSDPIYWNVHWHQEKLIFEMETTLSDLRTRHLISRIIDLLAAHKAFHKCAMRIKTDYETRHIHITVLKY